MKIIIIILVLLASLAIGVIVAKAQTPSFVAIVDVDDDHYEFIQSFCDGFQVPCQRYGQGGDITSGMAAAAADRPMITVVEWSSPYFYQPWQDGLKALSESGTVYLPAGNSPKWRNHPAYSEYAIVVGALDVDCQPKFTVPDGIELFVQATWTSWAALFAGLRDFKGIPLESHCRS